MKRRNALRLVPIILLVLAFMLSGCAHTHIFEDGVCSSCGFICGHRYVKSVCEVCGKKCEHLSYTDGKCSECEKPCTHKTYEDGVCSLCQTPCAHPSFNGGVCIVCKLACAHDYKDGVCSVCNTECSHEYENKVCVICGSAKQPHYDYVAKVSQSLPKINIVTDTAIMTQANMGFNMYDTTSKDNRPYYDCKVSVSNCAQEYALADVDGQIKIRGNYTANYPKKPFRIKFAKKQKMLGLNNDAECKSWVLLADYKDMTMERNSVAFWLAKQIFGSDDYYSTDFRQVELSLNGTYWGTYLLAEQQQVDANRVDIAEPKKNDMSTNIGYMLEYDGYYRFESEAQRFYCNYNNNAPLKTRSGNTVYYRNEIGFSLKNDVYYESEDNCAQKKFIENYINNLYTLCYEAVYKQKYYAFNDSATALVPYTPVTSEPVRETVSRVVDIRSLVDAYILNEIACDADIDWSSFYMDVDFGEGGDKLLRFEAPWDFDSALGLKSSCQSGKGLFAAESKNPWLVVFINEDWFQDEIKNKWKEMAAASVQSRCIEYANTLMKTYAGDYRKNFDKWTFHIDGEVNSEARKVKNHAEAVSYLCNWLNVRFDYLNTQWL